MAEFGISDIALLWRQWKSVLLYHLDEFETRPLYHWCGIRKSCCCTVCVGAETHTIAPSRRDSTLRTVTPTLQKMSMLTCSTIGAGTGSHTVVPPRRQRNALQRQHDGSNASLNHAPSGWYLTPYDGSAVWKNCCDTTGIITTSRVLQYQYYLGVR